MCIMCSGQFETTGVLSFYTDMDADADDMTFSLGQLTTEMCESENCTN
jgi:hypothetical protein